MGDLNLEQLAAAEAAYEEALGDDSLWEADPSPLRTPSPGERQRLAAQVTIRLSPEVSELLRNLAAAAGIGYTSLIRQWIDERVAEETMIGHAPWHRVHYTVADFLPSVSEMEARRFSWSERREVLERA